MIRPKATSALWLPPKSLADGLIAFSGIGKEKNHNALKQLRIDDFLEEGK